MKLLGKEVKVGTRVRLRRGDTAEIMKLDGVDLLPFGVKVSDYKGICWYYQAGNWHADGAEHPIDIVEVLDEPQQQAEDKPFILWCDNIGYAAAEVIQERDELRAKVDELAKEVTDLKDGQYAAMEQKAEELLISRDFWREKAETATALADSWRRRVRECVSRIERLEAVLKGTPAPRPPDPEEQEVMQWMQENSKLMDMLGDE